MRESAAFDRIAFAFRSSLKPDCVCAIRRKAGTVTPISSEQSLLCSPVC